MSECMSGLAYDAANPEESYYGSLGLPPQRISMSEPKTIDKRREKFHKNKKEKIFVEYVLMII